ncbi:cytochrome protein [Xylariales sp. AK1849]|nr:cytochrome protein [Xylariales sp. AK1849]
MVESTSAIEQHGLSTFAFIGAAFIAYIFLRAVYNLYLHPLRNFPGPKLAAVGPFHEFYHDVIRDGMFMWEVERMHQIYGPIVRVNPNELHILDPHYYSTVYAGNHRGTDKYHDAVAAFTVPKSSLATIQHKVHRLRRSILSPYFSKAAVVRLEPAIHERIGRLCSRLEETMRLGQVADLDAAFAALTADIVTTYFYGQNLDYLGYEAFKFEIRDAILGLIQFYHFTRFFPWVAETIKRLPIPIMRLIHPGASYLVSSQENIKDGIRASRANGDKLPSKSVIVQALEDPTVPVLERTLDRLGDEGTTIIFAGTETTARALSVGMFHILNNETILNKLREELDTLPGVPNREYTYSQLESLPYLSGAIQESLRLSHGPSVRLPRVSPDKVLKYGDHVIPPGIPVSMSSVLVHLDSSIFPDPQRFDPGRWVKPSKERVNLDRFMVAFTKGTRQCLGITLAYAEMYLTFAKLIGTFKMEIHDTTPDDVKVYHIRLTGAPKRGRGEVKVKIVEKIRISS